MVTFTGPMNPLPLTLGVLLALAVRSDLREGRITNRLVATGLSVGALLQLGVVLAAPRPFSDPAQWLWIWGPLAGGATLLPLYLLRACGAGDVKLMAMVGAFLGPDLVLSAALYTFMVGGLLSLAVMALRGVSAQTFSNIRYLLTDWGVRATTGQGLRLAPLTTTAARLPYAVAIAAGTLVALIRPLPLLE